MHLSGLTPMPKQEPSVKMIARHPLFWGGLAAAALLTVLPKSRAARIAGFAGVAAEMAWLGAGAGLDWFTDAEW